MKGINRILLAISGLLILGACSSTCNENKENCAVENGDNTTLAINEEIETISYHQQFNGCKAHQ